MKKFVAFLQSNSQGFFIGFILLALAVVLGLELSGHAPVWLHDALHRGARNALRSG